MHQGIFGRDARSVLSACRDRLLWVDCSRSPVTAIDPWLTLNAQAESGIRWLFHIKPDSKHCHASYKAISLAGAHCFRTTSGCVNANKRSWLGATLSVQDYSANARRADHLLGIFQQRSQRKGHFKEAELRPHIIISSQSDRDLAMRLHDDAHHECFIANSVNFPIKCRAVINYRN
ncbi:OsmC family protein [Pseudomonas sp. B21-031]|uniref:OsmC family protein n=1 Tax=Pseudomonas sp. B21-031 TaxID=2895482 RepID=UPI00215EAFC2|nr:hypothetical protein [Pseudomonas sp. B21-031]UVL64830.1 hypothetical protein LOY53_15470 [Pseudomonas sp. B21-031]